MVQQEEFLIERSRVELAPTESTAEGPVTRTETEVSDLPFISPQSYSSRPKIIEISSSNEKNIVDESTGKENRPRTRTVKGRAYQCNLKKNTALAKDRELRTKLRGFEELVSLSQDTSVIRKEISVLTKLLDDAIQSFDEWMELSDESSETQRALTKQVYLIDTRKLIHATAIQRLQTIEEDKGSVSSRKSHYSQSSSSSASKPSRISCKETLINFRAVRAALEEALKFSAVIAEQENKLKQLKIKKELGEIAAQEAVYKEAANSESQLYDEQPPLLPTTQHDVVAGFLETGSVAGLTSTPGAPNPILFNQETCPASIALALSSPAITPTESEFQVQPPALSSVDHTTPVVPT